MANESVSPNASYRVIPAALRCIWQALLVAQVLQHFKPLVEMIYVVGTDVAQILIFHSITDSILLF